MFGSLAQPNRRTGVLWLRVALLCTVVVLTLAQTHPASFARRADALETTIVVTKTEIENTDGNGCSFYEALQAVFSAQSNKTTVTYHECTANSGPAVIEFGGAAAGGTITMVDTLDLPMIRGEVTINGPVTFDGGGDTNNLHVFRVPLSTSKLNLNFVTIRDAHTSGGGAAILVNSTGTLNLFFVSMINNVAEGNGGAIHANGTVNVVASSFAGNRARGIMPDMSDNAGTGFGGALYVSGSQSLNVSISTFNGNIADKGGGAIFFSASRAEISDTTFNGNVVLDDPPAVDEDDVKGGGAIANDGQAELALERVAFDANLSLDGDGGAIFNNISATSLITDTSFNANVAGDPTDAQRGGAIYNRKTLKVFRSAFIVNGSAKGDGGAIANDRGGVADVSNSTFSANAAVEKGGALWNGNSQVNGPASTVELRHVTFSDNAGQEGGVIFNETSGGHSVSVGNTIVNGGVSPGDNCNTPLSSLGHNIDSGNTCGFDQSGDRTSTDPKLGTLGFNGGPATSLLSHLILSGSPAIDAGDADICSGAPVKDEDQRGESRSNDGDGDKIPGCDIGALESDAAEPGFGSTPVQPGPIHLGNTTFNTLITNTFSVYETGNITLTLFSGTLGGPDSAQFNVVTAFPLHIRNGRPAVPIELGCTPVGPQEGQRTATLTLTTNDVEHVSVDYDLTCNGGAAPVAGFGSTPIPAGPIDFGSVEVGQSVTPTLSFEETGDATLTLSNPLLAGINPGDFSVVTPFPINIADGAGPATVELACSPQDYGIRMTTLTLSTNDPSRSLVSYNLVCDGVPAPTDFLAAPGQSLSDVSNIDGANGLAVSPDGKHVYVTGFVSDKVAVYSRDPDNGQLSFIASESHASFDGPRMLAVSPDGSQVYMAAELSGTFVLFQRDPASGALTFQSAFDDAVYSGLAGAYDVAISPDGRHIYVTGSNADAIVIFNRDVDGVVSYQGAIVSFDDLDEARGIAVSPDGRNVYVTAFKITGDGSVAMFARDAIDGSLAHLDTISEGDCLTFPWCLPVDGLDGAFDVTVSPDGAHIYTSSARDDAVMVFRRDLTDGRLSVRSGYADGVGGIDGLAGAHNLVLSPDGEHLYVTGSDEPALAVFKRDATSGLLQQFQVVKQENPGELPLVDGAFEVATSPDGSTVYTAAWRDDSVVALPVANPKATLQSLLPASAAAGSSAFSLVVKGRDFVDGAQVTLAGSSRPTTYVNSSELHAEVGAADVAAAGPIDVMVTNPGPGGGSSYNSRSFLATAPGEKPVPSVDHIIPQGAPAGDAAFTVTVVGANFTQDSAVQWNGVDLDTSYVSGTELKATVNRADIAQPGPAGVTVVNPAASGAAIASVAAGGGASNPVPFTAAAPGENAAPSITGVDPFLTVARGAGSVALTLQVRGHNFVGGATVQWNGQDRPTRFVSGTELRVTILGADVALPGTAGVTVYNPAPGGGLSNTFTFTIVPYAVYLPALLR